MTYSLPGWIEIDLDAITLNIQKIQKHISDSVGLIAVVNETTSSLLPRPGRFYGSDGELMDQNTLGNPVSDLIPSNL